MGTAHRCVLYMYSRHGQFSNIFCFYLFFATRGEKATSNQRVEPTPQSWENTSLTLSAVGSHQNIGRCLHNGFPSNADATSVCNFTHKSADESGVCCFPDQQTRCASRKPSIDGSGIETFLVTKCKSVLVRLYLCK